MSTDTTPKRIQVASPAPTPERIELPSEPVYTNPNVANSMAEAEGLILNKTPTEIEVDASQMKLSGSAKGNDARIAELNRQQAIVNERAATVDTINRNVAAGFGPEGAAADIVGDSLPPNLGIYAEANERHQKAQEFAGKYPVTAAYATTDNNGRQGLSRAEADHNAQRNFDAEGGANLAAILQAHSQRNLDIARTREEIDDLTVGDMARGVALSIVPFADAAQHVNIYRNIAGIAGISENIDAMSVGQLRQQVRESLDQFPVDIRALKFQQMVSALQNNPEYPVSDLLTNEALKNIHKTLLTTGGRGYNFEDGIEDFFLAVDSLFGVAGVARWVKQGKAAGKAWKSQRAAQNDFVKDYLAAEDALRRQENMQPWQLNIDPEAAATLNKGNEALNSQLPKIGSPDDPLTEVPDGVVPLARAERERVVTLEAKAQQLLEDADARNYTEADVKALSGSFINRAAEYWGGRLRPAMTTWKSGFNTGDLSRDQMRFTHTLGMNDRVGFLDSRMAVEEAQELIEQGFEGVHIVAGPEGGKLTKVMDADEIAKGATSVTPGNYYVRFDEDYFLRPSDKTLFGEGSRIIGPEYLGKAGRYILTPSAQFDPKFWGPAVRAFGTEQAVGITLRAIAEPIWRLPAKVRGNIDTMYRWAGDYTNKNGVQPTTRDFVDAFPDVTIQELEGVTNIKAFYDTLYTLNNRKLYKDFLARGFKSLRSPTTDMAYHGKVLDEDTLLSSYFKGKESSIEVLDPTTNLLVSVKKEELIQIMKNGGGVLETPLKMTDRAGNKATLVLKRTDSGDWKLGELAQNPLKYEDWYSPRAYEDFWAIKSKAKVKVNGREVKPDGDEGEIIGYARTEQEAVRFMERIARNEGVDPSELAVVDTGRKVGTDRTAADMDHWQVEGRLMFDNRGQEVPAAYGKADIFSPTNMLQRSADMVARDLAMTDTLNVMKTQWQQSFGKLIGLNPMRASAQEITDKLNRMIGDASKGAEKTKLLEAHQSWDYIRYVEGNVNRTYQEVFRRAATALGDLIADPLLRAGEKGGLPNTVGEWVARNAHRTSPARTMKTLAFYDFMVSRPTRQLGLQALQQWSLYGLEPQYGLVARLNDSHSLMQGWKIMRDEAGEFAGGPKLKRQLLTRNAKSMGLSLEEYQTVVDRIYDSGLLAGVDKHSFAGDLRTTRHTPDTRAGKAVQATARPVKAVFDIATTYGFSLGEQLNVAGSFNQALRLWRKANNNKAISAMTNDDWDEVVDKSWAFAQSMNRMDSAAYTEGLLQLPMQFLSFSHKMILTGLRGVPVEAVSKFGRKDFTPAESRRILLGQLALWGPAGLGVNSAIDLIFDSNEELQKYKDTEVYDAVLRGAIDWSLNAAISMLEDSPSHLAFTENFAPGAGASSMVLDSIIDLVTEGTIESILSIGASGNTVSGYGEAIQKAEIIYGLKDDRPAYDVAWRIADQILQGGFSGFSDARQAYALMNLEKKLGSNGKWEPVEAKISQILAKGLLGVRDRAELNAFALRQEINSPKELQKLAKDYQIRINEIAAMYPNDPTLRDEMILDHVGALNSSFANDAERAYFMYELKKLEVQEWGQIGTNPTMLDRLLGAALESAPLDFNAIKTLAKPYNMTPEEVDLLYRTLENHKILPSAPIPGEE